MADKEGLPPFEDLEDHELRHVLAELQMEFDIAEALLDRALAEVVNRKKDKREGVVRMKTVPVDPPSRTH